MKIFMIAGDMSHLLSILVVLLKIHKIKSCAGISLKTQELYLLIFVTRYLDLFTDFLSFYNSLMKLIFLGTSVSIVWYIRQHKVVKQTYNKAHDTFWHYLLIIPCFLLALLAVVLIGGKFTLRYVMLCLWAFSICLEAVAIIPQLVLIQRTKNVDNFTGNYVFFLGTYRGLYLLNWTCSYFTDKHFRTGGISLVSGIVQTLVYVGFFSYYYITSWSRNERLKLPD